MGESAYKHITAEEFAKIDKSTVTVVDLREPDEVLLSAFENAVNIPFPEVTTSWIRSPKISR